jgi:hypothetical protein
VKFYKSPNDPSTSHTGTLWSASGQQLATGTFTSETASGWQTLTFSAPVAIAANTLYVVSVHFPNGEYTYTPGFFTSPAGLYPLTAPASGNGTNNGLYAYNSATTFPTGTYNSNNYWVDVIFTASSGGSQNSSSGPSEPGQ